MVAGLALSLSPALAHAKHELSHPGPPACLGDPHPCGSTSPAGEEPFDLKEVKQVDVPSSTFRRDEVRLRGWIGLPDVPEGVKVPTVLLSTPYLGSCVFTGPACTFAPNAPGFWREYSNEGTMSDYGAQSAWGRWGISPIHLIRAGYAVAFFSVRGTGGSGGCFSIHGADERRDQATLVNWVAAQKWSNARVGMGGLSYDSSTAMAAAMEAPRALKTIVVAGVTTNYYSFIHTPQGALGSNSLFFEAMYAPGPAAPALGQGVPSNTLERPENPQDPAYHEGIDVVTRGFPDVASTYARNAPGRLCDDFRKFMTEPARGFAADPDRPFYEERNFLDDLGDVKASVLLTQGFADNNFHAFQDDPMWAALTKAPKRQIVGQWRHRFPAVPGEKIEHSSGRYGARRPSRFSFEDVPATWQNRTWEETVIAWFDYWLKGQGKPERLGTVDYQDGGGTWRESTAWPPAEQRQEVLYLRGSELAAASTSESTESGDASFLSAPNAESPFCDAPVSLPDAVPPNAVAFSTGVTKSVTLAGSAFAYLRVSSDHPGGVFGAYLLRVGPNVSCAGGRPTAGVDLLAMGGADLRFHRGDMIARAFPLNTKTHIRVDLFDLAETIKAGDRLVLVLSTSDPRLERADFVSRSSFPKVTVHADGGSEASQLVLPVVAGSLGGETATLDYPPRPYTSG